MSGFASVTVIVPFHNAMKDLDACLQSLNLDQTESTVRILLVDDGSSDGSSRIAAEWQSRFPNQISLQATKHEGPGAARNLALASVQTEYLTFVDSDDRLAPGAIDSLMRVAAEFGADVVVGKLVTAPVPVTKIWDEVFEGGDRRLDSLNEARALIHSAGACGKLFRTEFVKRSGAQFAPTGLFEDIQFTVPLMLQASIIGISSQLTYLYTSSSVHESRMNARFTRPAHFFDLLNALEKISECSAQLHSHPDLLASFVFRAVQGALPQAAGSLGKRELSRWFAEISALLRQFDIVDGLEHTRWDYVYRLPLLAAYANDFDAYRKPASAIEQVDISESGIYLKFRSEHTGLSALPRELARTNYYSAHLLKAKQIKDGRLRLRIRVGIPGIPGALLRRTSIQLVKSRLLKRVGSPASPRRCGADFVVFELNFKRPISKTVERRSTLRVGLASCSESQLFRTLRPTDKFLATGNEILPLANDGKTIQLKLETGERNLVG